MIPHNLPSFDIEERLATARVLETGWVAQGTEVEAFEKELCEFFNLPSGHAIAVSSGSAALFLALWVLNGNQKRIGLPVYACSALRNAVGLINGKSIYIDCGSGGPNLDLEAAQKLNLDILIAPSIFGIPIELQHESKFKIIEDIAQSLGSTSKGQPAGIRGDIGICSFYATKMITSGGQGGAVISRNFDLIEKIRDYRKFDCRNDSELRFNFQMTDIQAAIGREQLKKLPIFIKKRECLFNIYSDYGLKMIESNDKKLNNVVRYRAVMRCDDPQRLIEKLLTNGIRAIVPIQLTELLDGPNNYPVAEELTLRTVSLPIYPSLDIKDAKKIASIAREFS